MLLKNIDGINNIIPLNYGIFNKNCKLSLSPLTKGEWSYTSFEDKNGDVKSITMYELLEKFNFQNIDLLKINIEGVEKELFENYNWLNYVKNMYISFHDKYKPMASLNFFKAIINYNYVLFINNDILFFKNIKNNL